VAGYNVIEYDLLGLTFWATLYLTSEIPL